jgi:hypothetical protein
MILILSEKRRWNCIKHVKNIKKDLNHSSGK